MRLKEYMNEKYLTRAKDGYGGFSFEIFVNPSARDIKDLKGSTVGGFRFIASDKTKNVYVFQAELLHYLAWKQLLKRGYERGNRHYLANNFILPGYADVKGNKLIYNHETLSYINEERSKKDWTFADKYVQGLKEGIKEYINSEKFKSRIKI